MVKNNRLRKREFKLDVDTKKVNLIICISSVVMGLSVLGFTYMSRTGHVSAVDSLNSEISKLEGDFTKLEYDGERVNEEELKQALYSAKTAGDKVTVLQNTWGESLTAKDREEADKEGNQSADAINTTRIERLKEFFEQDSDGIKNWFPKAKGTKAEDSSWKFMTTTSFTSVNQDVLWQNRGKDGELYAYVTAVFDAKSNKFTLVKPVITKAGTEAIKSVLKEGEN